MALSLVLYAVAVRRYVWLPSYLKVASFTTLNIALNALTLGRYVWLEGRVRKGVFMNWARPHLGKFCESFNKADMAGLHGENFARFLEVVEDHDPEGKFVNSFTWRLFGIGHS